MCKSEVEKIDVVSEEIMNQTSIEEKQQKRSLNLEIILTMQPEYLR